ncbi:MAG: hypothetical protein ACREDS_02150 [Limisphaerales bacterium]
MKRIIAFICVVICFGLLASCVKKNSPSFEAIKNPNASTKLKSFAAEKREQARTLAAADGDELPPEVGPFFAAAEKEDWEGTTNNYSEIKRLVGRDSRFRKSWWQATMETFGAMEQFTLGDEKYAAAYGNDIIDSIPSGSIYFGGTDPGRFIVTAMEKSQVDGDPFFTLTQNALVDGSYLDYLQSMYGDKIYIPTKEDSQKSFRDYMADAQLRQKENKLKPGEDVKVYKDGRVTVSGQVAVMEINGLLAKIIFDKNTNREFYVEESFPLDWMYPYLEPHGLIFKINRQPLPELSDEIVQRDHDYWTKTIQPMIGDWLDDDTSVQEIADFAKKVFVQHDFSGFTGDPQFVQNDYSCKMFSKERANIAGLYVWRMKHAANADEKERMAREADFAFRQAFALCPYSQEIVFQYVNFLLSQNRGADALSIAETAAKMPEIKGQDVERQFHSLIEQLEQFQRKS